MVESVYLDTTIPSYISETRASAEIMPRKELTVKWWQAERKNYRLVASPRVFLEIERTPEPKRAAMLELMREVEMLEMASDIEEIVGVYIANKAMPSTDLGDAFHVAFASFYKIDYLLTWNVRHLANVNKLKHIHFLNARLGLYIPQLVTPEQLFKEED